jgi:hypothetical protein
MRILFLRETLSDFHRVSELQFLPAVETFRWDRRDPWHSLGIPVSAYRNNHHLSAQWAHSARHCTVPASGAMVRFAAFLAPATEFSISALPESRECRSRFGHGLPPIPSAATPHARRGQRLSENREWQGSPRCGRSILNAAKQVPPIPAHRRLVLLTCAAPEPIQRTLPRR